MSRAAAPACRACRTYLFEIFRTGFASPTKGNVTRPRFNTHITTSRLRTFSSLGIQSQEQGLSDNIAPKIPLHLESQNGITKSEEEMEATVRDMRQTFGETLPAGALTDAEFAIYRRLYGTPIRETSAEDIALLSNPGEEIEAEDERKALFVEDGDGQFEEVIYAEELSDLANGRSLGSTESLDDDIEYGSTAEESRAMKLLQRDIEIAAQNRHLDVEEGLDAAKTMSFEQDTLDDDSDENTFRVHALTAQGRFSTNPTTIQLPGKALVEPITALISSTANKHLDEVSKRVFGGPGLPNSVATPSSKRHLQQAPIGLEASQGRMGTVEADCFLTAMMPGMYSSILSILVEVRKRLGADWLRELMEKPGGPRVFDAGAGGAGVMAWREMLRAELEVMYPDRKWAPHDRVFGKATVIIGSDELRVRASALLDNTTFLPRLPDFEPERDLPATLDIKGTLPRRRYDVVLAPHTLWTLKDEKTRKLQLQNFWSLLNPEGGVLVMLEKGVPRGFELVAGARRQLLDQHIASPGSFEAVNEVQDRSSSGWAPKEEGMIIAPCTNHDKCPMYTVAGRSAGRKDICHFSQRYIRPPFLQRLLGAKHQNHEDIRFSYLAVRRGADKRSIENIVQNEDATAAAFAGYETAQASGGGEAETPIPHVLSLPRTIMPPLKRRGHVTLDLCTPSGTLERWTVPKSFSKQAYRDARKSSWGDLWALGAKTRVMREARAGKGGGSRREPLDDADSELDDSELMPGIPRELRDQLLEQGTVQKRRQSSKRRTLHTA